MMKFAILFALVAAAVAESVAPLASVSPTGRIVGGQATSIDVVPYQVSLQVFGSHICGGSIISDQWILSAAHCIIYPVDWYTIRSGSTLVNSGGAVTTLTKAINHENYYTNSFRIPVNDIAVLQLSSALSLSSTQAVIPLFAAGQPSVAGSNAIITGWGYLTEQGGLPIVLQTVTIPIVSQADCSAVYAMWGGLPEGQICAAVTEGGLDACDGDSGGPLAIDGVLAGIVSWGNGCARPGLPGAYSEVAFYREWIATNSGV